MTAQPSPPANVTRIHCPNCDHFLANFVGSYLDPKPCHNCHQQIVVWSAGGVIYVEKVTKGSANVRERVDRNETTRHDPTNQT